MLRKSGLDSLKPRRHKAGLEALLQEIKHWDTDAKKCLKVKLTEWELDGGRVDEEEEGEGGKEENEEQEKRGES